MAGADIRIVREDILADHYHTLKNVTYEQRREDGAWETQTREVYDNASGAVVLPYDRQHRRVVLTRQFRVGARLNGHDGWLLEAPAGVLDEADPAARARSEALEETGYALTHLEPVMHLLRAVPGRHGEAS